MNDVPVKDFFIGNKKPLALIAGPCVIESEELALSTAAFLKKLCVSLNINLIYKSSYDKANRSSFHSFRGPGIEEGLCILEKVKHTFDIPILTDVHSKEEATAAGQVCDVIQIPAFLCRQTDLLIAAGMTPAVVNVKKGQFMAPWDMKNVVDKLLSVNNRRILLTDRGTSFGYNNLVSDMRTIPLMQKLGFPVCFDASHSVQLPGALGSQTGGQAEFIPILTKAAIAAGCNCLFIECHPTPHEAKSDKDSLLSLEQLTALMKEVAPLYNLIQGFS
jgi:2-dehydro-3-deoxyphosphooctonate aldolase (KDO 8-P synthase)